MKWLYFSYNSVGVFAAFLILFIMQIYLFTKKDKTPPTYWLAGTFFGFSILLFGYTFAYSVFSPSGAYHRYMTVCFTLFANVCYTGFGYYFPRNDRPREAKIVLPIAFTIAALASFEFIFRTISMEKFYNFTSHTYNFDYGGGTAVVILLTQFLAFIILARKTIRYSSYDGRFINWLIKPDSASGYPKFILARFLVGWIKFLNPKGKDAHAAKSFAKSIMILLTIAICNVLNKNGIISYDLYALIFSNLTLFACFYIFITYLNNSPEPTSFMVKLVGVSVVTVVFVLGYISNITLSISEEDYDNQRKAQIQGVKQEIINRHYDLIPNEIEYILVKPANADIFDKTYTAEFIRTPDSLTSELINTGFDKYRTFNIKEQLTKVLKEHKRNILKDTPTEEETEEALNRFKNTRVYKNLVKDNSIELNRLYREAGNLYVHYDFIIENAKYEIGFSYHEYRKHTHKNVSKVFILIFITVIIVLVLFPRIFQTSLVRPLNNLLDGVKKVNEGDLSIEVPIKVHDEIGYLSESFNSMVGSIRQARNELQDYADNLEEKVVERTKEVQEKMEEVHKLKVQQDGDYFLTSLLAKPLFFNANKSKRVTTEFLIRQKKKFEFRNKSADLGGDICITGNLRFGTQNNHRRYTMILNGDAMGKSMQGAGGSLVMGVVINSIMSRSASNNRILNSTPEQWLTDLYNEVNSVFKSFNGTMVISATVFLVDNINGQAYFFNAEHPSSILYRDGVASFIESELTLRKLGLDSEFEFKVHNFKFEDGDVLILGSDGRDDIDLTPNDAIRTINEDENMILRIVEEAKGSIQEIENILLTKGTITDDLSFLKLVYQGSSVEESDSIRIHSPVQTSKERTINDDHIIDLDKEPENTYNITEIYQESKALYQKGDVNKALEILMSAYSIDPSNQKLNKLLGLISFKGKDYATAVDVLSKYLQQDPDTEEMWYYLSLSQKRLGNYLGSLEASRKVFEIQPENINNLVNLSDLYRLTGKFSEAREYSEKVLQIDPENQNAKKILDYIGKK
jgi:HAMP domain-containing protein